MKVTYRINGKEVSSLQATEQEQEDFKQMLEEQKFPGISTDDTFLSGIPTLDKQFAHPKHHEAVVKAAKRQGYTPKPTDYYVPALAQRVGDPRAFLNHGHAKGAARKYAEELGVAAEGAITTKAREPEKDPYENPKHRLAPRIVDRIARQKIKENPDLARINKQDLRDEIISKHGKQK
jgi:hypothetical protein